MQSDRDHGLRYCETIQDQRVVYGPYMTHSIYCIWSISYGSYYMDMQLEQPKKAINR